MAPLALRRDALYELIASPKISWKFSRFKCSGWLALTLHGLSWPREGSGGSQVFVG